MNKDENQTRPSIMFAATLGLVCVIAISPCVVRAQDNEKVNVGLSTWKTSDALIATVRSQMATGKMMIFRSARICGQQGSMPLISESYSGRRLA